MHSTPPSAVHVWITERARYINALDFRTRDCVAQACLEQGYRLREETRHRLNWHQTIDHGLVAEHGDFLYSRPTFCANVTYCAGRFMRAPAPWRAAGSSRSLLDRDWSHITSPGVALPTQRATVGDSARPWVT
jgi:hypothetical protein